jgi:hypothetical protein
MHNQNVNNVRRSVREGVAVTIGEAYLMVRSDATGVLSLRDFDRVLARIPQEQRQVILLIGLEGTSYEEAAAVPFGYGGGGIGLILLTGLVVLLFRRAMWPMTKPKNGIRYRHV